MKKISLFSLMLCGFNPTVWADGELASGSVYLAGAAGAAFPHLARPESSAALTAEQYLHQDVDPAALFTVLGGYTWATNQTWLPFYSLGAGYTYGLPSRAKGTLFQYGLPQHNTYDYQYKIEQQALLAHMKANVYRYHDVMPFVSVGMGLASNHTNQYHEIARPNIAPRVSPNFSDFSNHHFGYTVGAGVDYVVKNNLWVGFEFNYGDFGDVQTGRGQGLFSADYLKSTLTANAVALNVYYFLDKVG